MYSWMRVADRRIDDAKQFETFDSREFLLVCILINGTPINVLPDEEGQPTFSCACPYR
jgi:hypothetical protein